MFPVGRIVVVIFVLIVGRCLEVAPASAQVESGAEAKPGEAEEARAARERMLDRWSRLQAFEQVAGRERDVERLPAPIFTFSDSTREAGHLGTLWAWGLTGRPAALLSQNKSYREQVWGFELVALVEGVTVVMHDDWRWTPASAVTMIRFEDAPPAADTESRRLVQMRSLARRFKVSEEYFDESFELRLLPQPAYRYQDPAADLIDGALFIYAHGTNPETIAVIECRRETTQTTWSYGFVPLAGAGVSAKLDGKTVWTKLPTRESKAQESYSTWLETESP